MRIILLLLTFLQLSSPAYGEFWIGISPKDSIVNQRKVVIIMDVVMNSPAYYHGLQEGDILTQIDNDIIISSSNFIELIKKRDSANIALRVERGGTEKVFNIKLGDRYKITVERKRKFNLSHFWFYNVIINDIDYGTISDGSTEDYWLIPINNINTIYFESNIAGISSISEHISFTMRNGYSLKVILEGRRGIPDVFATEVPTVKTEIENKARILKQYEFNLYKRVTSDSSLAPRWFKKEFRQSLEGNINNVFRGVFLSNMFQSKAIVRLLLLTLLMYPVVIITDKHTSKKTVWLFPLLLLSSYLLSYLLAWIINIIIYITKGYNNLIMPPEFIFFILVLIGLLFTLFFVTRSLFYRVQKADKIVEKTLGILGILISWVGFILTVKEIIILTIRFLNL